MSVVVVGIEQREAPLDLLERVAVTDHALPKALASLRDRANLSEAVVVSTCLRTEVYAVVERFHDGVAEIQDFMATLADTTVASLADHLVIRFDDDVADHLFTVASGLDSAVLGESEVLGQVRRAWEKAQHERASGPVLGSLFRHAVETGKRVRSETAIARGITSLSHGAVAMAASRRPGGLEGASILVVGAGEMGEGVAQALAGHGPAEVVVANRTPARAVAVVGALPADLAGAHPDHRPDRPPRRPGGRRRGLHLGRQQPPDRGARRRRGRRHRPVGRRPPAGDRPRRPPERGAVRRHAARGDPAGHGQPPGRRRGGPVGAPGRGRPRP